MNVVSKPCWTLQIKTRGGHPSVSHKVFKILELYVLDARTYLKFILCGLLQSLLSPEVLHKLSLKATQVTHMSHICFLLVVQCHPTRKLAQSFPDSINRRGRARHCTAVSGGGHSQLKLQLESKMQQLPACTHFSL